MLIVFLIRVVSGCWPEFSLWPEYSHVTSPGLMGRAKASVWCPLIGQTHTILTSDWPRAWVWSVSISLTPGQDGLLTTKPITPTRIGLSEDYVKSFWRPISGCWCPAQTSQTSYGWIHVDYLFCSLLSLLTFQSIFVYAECTVIHPAVSRDADASPSVKL